MTAAIKFFDCFAGIGGFRSGLEKAGGYECIGFCEIDKNAETAYRAMYDTEKEVFYNDITKINAEEMPDFDLFVGGFPCQPFSVAGKRRGFEDTRGTLFYHISRVIKHKRPAAFLLENVPGLQRRTCSSGALVRGKLTSRSSARFRNWGIVLNGLCITAQASEFRNPVSECTLSDILEQNVPEKYFLSNASLLKILNGSSTVRRVQECTPQTAQP